MPVVRICEAVIMVSTMLEMMAADIRDDAQREAN